MSELFFVLKSLVFTVLIVLSLQIKIGPNTLETRVTDWVESSWMTQQLQTVSKGMSLALEDGAKKLTNTLRKAFGNSNPEVESASRFNFELKRNANAIKEKAAE